MGSIIKIVTLSAALMFSYFGLAQALELSKNNYLGHRYITVSINPKEEKLEHYWKEPKSGEPFGSIHALKAYLNQTNKTLEFAINSGIYDADYKPLGLHIERGDIHSPLNLVTYNKGQGNFSLLPNGVFFLDKANNASIVETTQFKDVDVNDVSFATQSGPMLLINGEYNKRFIPDSDSLKIRSGVCVKDRQVYFVVTEDSVNFYEFASFFKQELMCQNALYLDGTLTRLYYQGKYYGAPFWNVRPYVGMWGVAN